MTRFNFRVLQKLDISKTLKLKSMAFILAFLTCEAQAIVGGNIVLLNDPLEKRVLLLSIDQPSDDNQFGPYHPEGLRKVHCSAVALSPRIILTAAHCLENKDQKIFASRASEGLTARTLVYHEAAPGFIEDITQDIALAVLDDELPADTEYVNFQSHPFQFKNQIQNQIQNQKFKTRVQAAGFGRTSGAGSAILDEGTLREVTLELLKSDRPGHVQTVNQYNGQGICSGDSGGPLYEGLQDSFKLIGIAQRVRGLPTNSDLEFDACVGTGQFTSVDSFKEWIQKTHQRLLKQFDQHSGL